MSPRAGDSRDCDADHGTSSTSDAKSSCESYESIRKAVAGLTIVAIILSVAWIVAAGALFVPALPVNSRIVWGSETVSRAHQMHHSYNIPCVKTNAEATRFQHF